jgi:hypothetical protein
MTPTCNRCQDVGWVCETHLDCPHATELANGCECARGVLCPDCRPRTGQSVWRVRGGRAAPVFKAAGAHNFEVSGHSPAPKRRGSSGKSFGVPTEQARPRSQREALRVRAQLRRC